MGIVLGLAVLLGLPSFVNAQDAPAGVTHGPLSGEVTETSAVLWARGGAAGDLMFTISTVDDNEVVAEVTAAIDEERDFAGEALVEGLLPATEYTFAVEHSAGGEQRTGSFTTTPASDEAAPLSFVFGACLGGQGYCRNPETGWAIFDTMASYSPDFFVMVGDGVYVDSACPVEDGQNVPGAVENQSTPFGRRTQGLF